MKHAVILAHPDPASFNAAVANTYAATVQSLGHEVVLRNLYALDFDPRLRAEELPWADPCTPGADVRRERAAIVDADVFVLVYPLWFNAPPAILKGWVDRVMSAGFGFRTEHGSNAQNLSGRKLLSFTSSGAPDHWVRQTGALDHLRLGFDDHLAGVCGLRVEDHVHFGSVVPGIRADAVDEMLAQVSDTARTLFKRGA